ncbi:hypothetical protein [Virgisporangium aurantiacum]|uniref:Uncharacterized protein n=1 Tax=Virgisporangium aurantiacum TaxID=175570 RepID=A0A8J3ZCB6_9ACTN|nr:hypothetical protein [Virgisporangium aurantiacum]GIJ59075.1 hypothetical protein Vau01_065910 [Virgisporangium aurantiacum]
MTIDATVAADRQFRVLGPLEVRCDGATLAIGPPKQRAARRAAERVRLVTAVGETSYSGRRLERLFAAEFLP